MTRELGNGFVEFRFFRPDSTQLYVAGEFNHWDCKSLPMVAEGDGWWRCEVRIPSGTYQFRYYSSDGKWFTDYASFGIERGPFGWNSVLYVCEDEHVKPRRIPMPERHEKEGVLTAA